MDFNNSLHIAHLNYAPELASYLITSRLSSCFIVRTIVLDVIIIILMSINMLVAGMLQDQGS